MKVKYYTSIEDNLHFLVFETFNKVYKWGLSQSDLRVLSEFYNTDFQLLKSVPKYEERMTVLFSKKIKEYIYEKLEMSYNTFNNILSRLRKKGIIEDNSIVERYLFDLNRHQFSITLDIINETGSKETTGKT